MALHKLSTEGPIVRARLRIESGRPVAVVVSAQRERGIVIKGVGSRANSDSEADIEKAIKIVATRVKAKAEQAGIPVVTS